ncbi:hypothetical protein EVAR_57697_1 [Eumeta japonica]|uniref:Uncharacterized protein n=1 Tax=Eumeta variegata TaxID=151549 RepID=A0A4C1Y7J3_EUMVA|nr:hypothetical protein EVAR_57697_1 [Eumeta japonica]
MIRHSESTTRCFHINQRRNGYGAAVKVAAIYTYKPGYLGRDPRFPSSTAQRTAITVWISSPNDEEAAIAGSASDGFPLRPSAAVEVVYFPKG